MEKEYEKLSANQLRELVGFLPQFEALVREFRVDAQASEKVKKAVKEDPGRFLRDFAAGSTTRRWLELVGGELQGLAAQIA